jgi:hypothetical protein
MDFEAGRCDCGARFVGEPLLEPPSPRPALGAAFGAVALAAVSLASLWKAVFLAFAPVAIVLGVRAVRASRRDSSRFGGRRTALAGLTLASLVAVGIGGRMIAGIPRALRERDEARAAATRAQLYHLAGDLQEYRARYGVYPVRLSDLAKLEVARNSRESRDSWEQKISYVGYTGGLASTGRPAAFNTEYELRSPGPDGEPNTADDVLMRTGIVVDPTDDEALVQPAETGPVPLEEPKPRKRAARGPAPAQKAPATRGPGSLASGDPQDPLIASTGPEIGPRVAGDPRSDLLC